MRSRGLKDVCCTSCAIEAFGAVSLVVIAALGAFSLFVIAAFGAISLVVIAALGAFSLVVIAAFGAFSLVVPVSICVGLVERAFGEGPVALARKMEGPV